MRRLRVHIRPGIEEQRHAAVLGRNEGGKRRALHARQSADQHLSADQDCAGIAGRDKGIRSLLANQLHADHERGILLFSHRNDRDIARLNHFRRRYNFEAFRRILLPHQLSQDFFPAAEQNLYLLTLLKCQKATLHNFAGRIVAAHCVHCNSHHMISPLCT